jgi:chromosomal replication initiator protein
MKLLVAEIQRAACIRFGISHADLLSECRERRVARPRQIAMYLARKYSPRSYGELGKLFGSRDHSTVVHGCHQICRLVECDAEIEQEVRHVLNLAVGLACIREFEARAA